MSIRNLKKLPTIFVVPLLLSLPAFSQNEFILTWQVLNNQSITIPTIGSGYNYTVDWGDGNVESGFTGDASHLYTSGGQKEIKITGSFPRIYFKGSTNGNRDRLITIKQWGDVAFTSMEGAFLGCEQMYITASDVPDLSGVLSMHEAFRDCYSIGFSTSNAFSGWDVSNVTDMSYLFFVSQPSFGYYPDINFDMGSWDVSGVTNMSYMFYQIEGVGAGTGIGNWNVSNVTNMSHLFEQVDLGVDLNNWNTGQVTNMSNLFTFADYNYSLSNWDVSNVVTMENIFAAFTHNSTSSLGLGNWDVSKVTNFSGALSTNDTNIDFGSIGNWDVSSAISMSSLFNDVSSQMDDISGWDVSNVTDMSNMFSYCSNITQDLSNWDVGNVTDMSQMFAYSNNLDLNIENWDVSSVTDMNFMFALSNGMDVNLGNWDISSITDMGQMFFITGISNDNYDNTLIGWATLSQGETQIPSNINFDGGNSLYCLGKAARASLISNYGWTISDGGEASPCSLPFTSTWQTTTANESITIPTTGSGYNYTVDWGDGNVESGFTGDASHNYANPGQHQIRITGDFPRIFFNNGFNGGGISRDKILTIDSWGDIVWTSMSGAFFGCSNLTVPALDAPDLSQVTDMSYMFGVADALVDIPAANQWVVSSIENMTGVFAGADLFNGNLSNWDVGNVSNLSLMFSDCPAFNGDISSWNVSSATSMLQLFQNATSFNRDISNWDVSNVTNLGNVLFNASAFNQDLSGWDISNLTGAAAFHQTGISTDNYDALLIGWSTLDVGESQIPTNVILFNTGLTYCNGAAAREELIDNFGWTIIDGGEAPSCLPLPVEWSYTAVSTLGKDQVLIEWGTAQEINTDYFEVEHSHDGRDFKSIGEVGAKGNSSVAIDYHFEHDLPGRGVNYYRIKQVDIDGAFTYSVIRSVEIQNKETTVDIFPNPATEILNIRIHDDDYEHYQIDIISPTGQVLSQQNGNNQIEVSHLPSGLYTLLLSNPMNGERQTIPFIKTN